MSDAGASRYNLLLLLELAYKQMDAAMLQRLRAAGFPELRAAHSQVFGAIAERGSRVGDMAEQAGITQQSMSELVDNLERLGYVERRPDARDRRAKIVMFTDRGWAAVRAAQAAIDDVEGDWASHIGAQRVAALRSALERIAGM